MCEDTVASFTKQSGRGANAYLEAMSRGAQALSCACHVVGIRTAQDKHKRRQTVASEMCFQLPFELSLPYPLGRPYTGRTFASDFVPILA